MYGYHETETLFLKIYLFNPSIVKKLIKKNLLKISLLMNLRLSELLLNGNIMGESFQTFESHVPYNLQFLMDYNLFGMNLIHLKSIKFRRQNPDKEENELNFDNFVNENLKTDKKWNLDNIPE